MSKTGFCKICKGPYAGPVAELLKKDKNPNEINRSLAAFDVQYDRHTIIRHREHVTSPLLTMAEAARAAPIIAPKSNTGVLEAIRDIGMARAAAEPETVSIDHALKAAGILAQRETKGDNILVILAKAVMAEQSPEISGLISTSPLMEIDGQFLDITPKEVTTHAQSDHNSQ